jgi:biopolymer transport protein TolR
MAGPLSSPSRRGRHRRSFRPTSDINVTPLVDVMLVLLIIFMITAPMLTVGVPVDLPKTQAAKMNDQIEPLMISVDAEGKTYFHDQELNISIIIQKLSEASVGNPDTKIYVRGDKKLAYGQIMEVMGAIAAAGFTKVSLIAELPTNASNPMMKADVPPTHARMAPSHAAADHNPPHHGHKRS